MPTWTLLALTLVVLSAGTGRSAVQAEPALAVDLSRLSLEELSQIQVTSVSRKSESLSSAAAAIHVITSEDLRRSGVTSLAAALRMAPGMEVAQVGSGQWGISARGFNNTYANKLLVLMDGRTLYTPLFSGVFWQETDTVLEDVDRIEVIRGPGATLWGANAVNGVINIVTKSARETQGTLISGGGGIEERGFGTVRYGTKLADDSHLRLYAKYGNHDDSTRSLGGGPNDDWWMGQSGFRWDWDPSEINTVTVQGDYYYTGFGGKFLRHSFTPPGLVPTDFRTDSKGGNVVARWTHQFSDDAEMSWQAYYDRTDRGFGFGRELRDTVDVDAQHRFRVGERHEIVWGGGYRFSTDDIETSPDFAMTEPSKGIQLVNLFVQDEVTLAPERLRLTFGSKLEHNDFTGFEVQPSGRVSWTLHEHHTLWTAVSRAVRTPSRLERDFMTYLDPIPAAPPGLLATLSGNPNFGSEELVSYEIGYRVTVHPRLTLDCAAFYNDYDHVRMIVVPPPQIRFLPTLHLLGSTTVGNDLFGETYGTEVGATWQPADSWRLRANYTFLETQFHTRGPIRSRSEDTEEGANPHHQVSLWSDLNLGLHVEWGAGLRYVDRLPFFGISDYVELDTRLAWKPSRNCELAVVGRNLIHPHHREFAPLLFGVRDTEVDRAVFGTIMLRF